MQGRDQLRYNLFVEGSSRHPFEGIQLPCDSDELMVLYKM